MEQRCRLCESKPASPQYPICVDCGAKLGLVPLPPPRRPMVPCTRCNGTKLVRVVPRTHATVMHQGAQIGHVYGSQELAAPMALTRAPNVQEHVLGNRTVDYQSLGHGFGLLETYVCAACGFVEWYCQDPQAIPIGPEYNTDVIEIDAQGPYR